MICIKCKTKVKKIDNTYGVCPNCNKKYTFVETYSRIVGYIRPLEQWNDSKQAEFHDRKLFTNKEQTTI